MWRNGDLIFASFEQAPQMSIESDPIDEFLSRIDGKIARKRDLNL